MTGLRIGIRRSRLNTMARYAEWVHSQVSRVLAFPSASSLVEQTRSTQDTVIMPRICTQKQIFGEVTGRQRSRKSHVKKTIAKAKASKFKFTAAPRFVKTLSFSDLGCYFLTW